jgi:DNA-directed RNA polymerase subunit alpha
MQPQRNWRDLLKPQNLETDEKNLAANYGKFVGEPFERGFGTTIGNALRRVLLSSLQGAAITALKIDGVLHEFATLPGVREDVTDIVLNLKEVRLKLHDGVVAHARIEAKGEGVVRAGHIQGGPGLEILNPDHPIATLSKEGVLKADLTVKLGRGYVPADRNKDEEAPVGTIPIDSIFSPVRKVNYTVTNARVGQRTDYDRLSVEVWTDGSVRPDDAVAYAARILQDQLNIFINFEETPEMAAEEEAAAPTLNENLFRPVAELELSVRSANCLPAAYWNN